MASIWDGHITTSLGASPGSEISTKAPAYPRWCVNSFQGPTGFSSWRPCVFGPASPGRQDGTVNPRNPKGRRAGLAALVTNEECAVVAAEAKHTDPPPQVPAWAVSAAETCAAKLNREDWPQKTEDLRKLASKIRRTEENLIKEHKCDPQTPRWLTIAWAKQDVLVPQALNRTDRHDRDISYWASELM